MTKRWWWYDAVTLLWLAVVAVALARGEVLYGVWAGVSIGYRMGRRPLDRPVIPTFRPTNPQESP